MHQGRACHTEDDGPTFVRKLVVHEKLFHHLCPKNWSFLRTHLRCYFFRFDGQFNHWRCLSRKSVVSAKYHFSKESGTRSHEGTSVPKPVFLAYQNPSVYPVGIITVVSIFTQQQCPKSGSLQAAIPRCFLGSKNFVDISPGLSQNRSSYLHLTDKGRTTMCKKWNFRSFFVNFAEQR